MSKMLQLAPDLAVPIEYTTEAIAIIGRRGSGKTNTAVVAVEEMIGAGQQVVVVDTVGVWWGLRAGAAGGPNGLDVVIFGGEHADVPLEESAGKVIANAIVDHDLSAIIDTSLLGKAAARRFLLAFVTELYHRKTTARTPLHVVFDEADELAPQRTSPESARLLSAMEDFVRRGRSRGLGVTLVTQRPAVLNKDVLTQVEVLIAMQLTGPLDVKAVGEWVRLNASEDQGREVFSTLSSLQAGEGWVWSPSWLKVLQRVRFRKRHTFDSSITPKIGEAVTRVDARIVDLTKLGEQIAATVEKAKAEDPALLRKENAELKRHIAALTETIEQTPTVAPEPVEVRVEIPVPFVPPEFAEEIREAARGLERSSNLIAETLAKWAHNIVPPVSVQPDVRLRDPKRDRPRTATPPPAPTSAATVQPAPAPVIEFRGESASEVYIDEAPPLLGTMHRAILTVLRQRGASTRRRIGAFAGKAHGGGAFTTAMGQLTKWGYVAQFGGVASITPAGSAALGNVDPLPTGQDLIDSLLGKMPAMERAIFETLIEAHPDGLTRAEIGERSGKASGGGAFTTAMGKLGRVELIRREGNLSFVSDEVAEAIRG